MQREDYSFVFSLFSKRVQMFHSGSMGIVVEKEPDVICIYGTDSANSKILCAVPLCDPKFLKGETYHISFFKDETALVSVADMMVYIDFSAKRCSNNKGLAIYGSEEWGHDISCSWEASYEKK